MRLVFGPAHPIICSSWGHCGDVDDAASVRDDEWKKCGICFRYIGCGGIDKVMFLIDAFKVERKLGWIHLSDDVSHEDVNIVAFLCLVAAECDVLDGEGK